MNVFAVTGSSDLAQVFMADMGNGRMVEFVEALQPPYPRNERWILMVSTMYGCPVKCLFCDAGGDYQGRPTAEEILRQVDYLVRRWYPDGRVPAKKFKIQFARMGEPAFNTAVLEALEQLPGRYDAPGLMPSVSTIAPHGADGFFEALIHIKNHLYAGGRFQFQFSVHTTDATARDRLIPVRKWTFAQMAEYGDRFYRPGDRKITLNFALADGFPADPAVLRHYFDPARYVVKLTPINPTVRASQNGLLTRINPCQPETGQKIALEMMAAGYETILAVGEVEENAIGSNCGQYVMRYLSSRQTVGDAYTYQPHELIRQPSMVAEATANHARFDHVKAAHGFDKSSVGRGSVIQR
ncbi:MAG: radical SAM protein [Verrucomicrobiia bacterium]